MKCESLGLCNQEITVEIIGSKWNLMILWNLSDKTLRFTELQKRMQNVNSKTITKHLRILEKNKIIKRVVYPEVPPRVEYSLTKHGEAFIPILVYIFEWGSTIE
jgi:DNA-binding HxlR family transcriptional regulator